MKQIDLSIVSDCFLQSYLTSIDVEKIENKLKELGINLGHDLSSIVTANVETIESKYLDILKNGYTKEQIRDIKKVFDYSGYRQKESFMEHFKKLDIKSCPFCNNNYVYFYKKDAKKYNTIATLEHYYPKSKYPHLSLSFYNLIPSCNTCNSKFKGNKTHEGKILHPYVDDFNEKAKFTVNVNSLELKKEIDLEINLNSNDTKCNISIDRFQLDKIYKEHDDIAKEIWNKAQVYNESRIDELHKEFYKKLGYTKEDVKKMIFCNYLKDEDINKRNHSKLTQDILKQFDLGI